MRLELQPQAERDLEGIGDYIAQDNPRRAVTCLRELRAQCRKILVAPQATGHDQNLAKASAPVPMAIT